MDCCSDSNAIGFYQQNYNPVFLYIQRESKGGVDLIDVINNTHYKNKTIYIQDKEKKCRFCGRSSPEVIFSKKAHSLPESIGNKLIVNRENECDECNALFAKFEGDLNNFLYPYLVLNKVKGKNGSKKYKSNDKSSSVEYDCDILKISEMIEHCKISNNDELNELNYEFDVQKYSLFGIYKIMVKMALSMLPEQDLFSFSIVKDCIMKDQLLGSEILLFDSFPGFNRFDFTVIGYKRKIDDCTLPFYQFAIMNGNFLLQVPIYCDDDIRKNTKKTISISCITVPTPQDCSEFGNRKTQIIKIDNKDETPSSKLSFVFHYDKKVKNT